MLRKLKDRAKRRALRVRKKFKTELPRVSVFRSLKYIYAQIIDDNKNTTLASCSSLELKGLKGDKKKIANAVGKELAKRAQEKGVQEVVFDRGSFLYHGRVKALADGLREGGLKI
ncbi:50S ribosomal protein L18 [Candidatus Dependentiae bacterium]